MSIGWSVNDKTINITALCVADAAAMLGAFNPNIFSIRIFGSADADTAQSVHIGMGLGSFIALSVGLGGTLVSGSWWPLVATLLALGVLCGAYEWALQNPHSSKGTA